MAPPAARPAASNPQSFTALPIPAKVGAGVMIVAVLGAIYYFALHAPLTEDTQSARTQHTSLETQMRDAQARQQEYIALREQLAAREGVDRANLRVLPEQFTRRKFLARARMNSIHLGDEFLQTKVVGKSQRTTAGR